MSFRGGYTFKNFEGTAQPVLRELALPKTVYIPLECSLGKFASVVAAGDPVHAGSIILKTDDSNPLSIVSPVNGEVSGVSEDGVTIQSDGTTHFDPVDSHSRAPWQAPREDVFNDFRSTGSMLLLGAAYDSLASLDKVNEIIINAVFNSPLNQSFIPGMAGDPFIFPNGLKAIKALFPNARITIAVNKRNRRQIEVPELKDIATVRVVSDKYPQDNPTLLSRDILKRTLISESGVRDESILVVPFFNVVQISEISTLGRPFIDRIVMIAGPGVSNPGWYRVRIGAKIEDIKHELCKSDEKGPWRVINGDLFSGIGVDTASSVLGSLDTEISVIREQAVRELYRFMRPGFDWDSYPMTSVAKFLPLMSKRLDTSTHGGERPCVQCNYCDEVCPVSLYPFLIHKYVKADKMEESYRLRPHTCIGCGLCDYVCPSKINISPVVGEAAESYRKSRRTDEIAD